MKVIIERVCGMDVHKDNITACVMTKQTTAEGGGFTHDFHPQSICAHVDDRD
ncbi:hypothetical protein SAMN05444673_3119 [Bacillus sp. OV166]|nr:hypothetical protein SAMN05444673_3119 [Bacillus sp. OV166]